MASIDYVLYIFESPKHDRRSQIILLYRLIGTCGFSVMDFPKRQGTLKHIQVTVLQIKSNQLNLTHSDGLIICFKPRQVPGIRLSQLA
jgi:hypothetical protein